MLMTTSTKSGPSAAMPPPSPPPGHVDEVIECTYTFEVGTGALSVEDATCTQVDGQLLQNIEHEHSYAYKGIPPCIPKSKVTLAHLESQRHDIPQVRLEGRQARRS